ncbi:MAG: hypothetical protein K9M10_03325 [Candidatus Pacebacteria bacterium]|nr:hypothetical protein [Candidatus Paceibacterota bacterium]MCF7857485.1 hypothetical protein [Candidatus Paceibacterota bacterium]
MTYIPRSPLGFKDTSGAVPAHVKKKHTFRIFNFIAGTLITVSFASAVGVFLYTSHAQTQLEMAKSNLQKESMNDSTKSIEEISLFDHKLNVAQYLLDNHIAPSLLFSELEGSTKESVQYDQFKFTYDPGFDAVLTLTGSTRDFSSVALQKMQFKRAGVFREFVVKDISVKNETGDVINGIDPDAAKRAVSFGITGLFDTKYLAYTGERIFVNEKPQEEVVETSPLDLELQGTASTSNEVTQ